MPDVVIDPICGMELNREEVNEQAEYGGRVYYFCSANCRNQFDVDPLQHTSEGERVTGDESGLGRRP